MIEWILQLEGQNMLQVHYSSGYDRYIYPDGYGNYETNMTRPQRKFMDNSIKVEMLNTDGWYRKFYYWLDKDNPNRGCPIIRLNRDAEKLDNLKTYNW